VTSDPSLFDQGVKFYHERDFAGAEKIFRQLLAVNPRDAQSLYMMAAIGYEVERYDFAEELIHMALAEDKTDPAFYFTLASIQKKLGKLEEAMFSYQEVIKLKPDHIEALLELAVICMGQGAVYRRKDMLEGALSFYTRALAIRADLSTYLNIGYTYHLMDNYRGVIEIGKACLKRYPDSIKSLHNIATSHYFLEEYEESLEYYQRLLVLEPNKAEIYADMSLTLKNLGRIDESLGMLKKALALSPDVVLFYHNILLTMVYASSVSPEELSQMAREFGTNITDPLRRNRPFKNNKNPHRRLRIGYVSGDFRKHPVSYFLAPVYKHNEDHFELYAYSKNEKDDEVTEELKKHFNHWRDIKYKSNDAAADMIEADKIDILVDLAGHTGDNGLMIFARKPAPIQVTWLGYPATTGMKAMDYRITDAYAEPPGMTEQFNTETLWRLPDIFCVYEAHKDSPPVIDHPPYEDNSYVTFGCFNNFTKVTDSVLDVWAQIMEKVGDSRLLLEISGIGNKKIRSEIEDRLRLRGLPMDRVILEPRKRENQFILYNKIDVALDPFPMVGGTTSMDALWMGVPIVTLAGRHFASRMGVSFLNNVGLPELIAENKEDYIKIATDLAQDREKLRTIRHNLRERTAKSPLMDQDRFVRNMEDAYRQMWQKWVASKG